MEPRPFLRGGTRERPERSPRRRGRVRYVLVVRQFPAPVFRRSGDCGNVGKTFEAWRPRFSFSRRRGVFGIRRFRFGRRILRSRFRFLSPKTSVGFSQCRSFRARHSRFRSRFPVCRPRQSGERQKGSGCENAPSEILEAFRSALARFARDSGRSRFVCLNRARIRGFRIREGRFGPFGTSGAECDYGRIPF